MSEHRFRFPQIPFSDVAMESFFTGTQQWKPQVKTLFKHIGGNSKEAVIAKLGEGVLLQGSDGTR